MGGIYSEISKNKYKSYLLVGIFFSFVLLISYVFMLYSNLGSFGISYAIIIAMLSSIGGYYYSDSIVLSISRAREVDKSEYPYLYNTIEGLSLAAGIPVPKMYIIDDSAPNAFATGRNAEHAAIAVTTGLLDKMNRSELEGVIAHEISHIKNYDTLLMTVAVVFVGIVALLSDLFLRSMFWGGGRRDKDSGKAGGILMVLGIVLLILAPFIATLLKLAISRKREFLADSSAALLTRYPEGLAKALEKLDRDTEPLEAANKATAHLYIINPLKDYHSSFDNLFSTHPPIKERINALRKM